METILQTGLLLVVTKLEPIVDAHGWPDNRKFSTVWLASAYKLK